MKKKFTFLIAALMLLTMITQPTRLWGQTKAALFTETFNSCNGTGGNDGYWSGSIASSTLTADNSGWTFVSGSGANKCAKIGAGKTQGSAETPSISVSGLSKLTLTFKAAAWSGDQTTLNLSSTNCTLKQNGSTITSVSLANAEWTTYTVDIEVTNTSNPIKIKFQGKQKNNARFFLDEVVVTPKRSITYAVLPAESGSVGGVVYGTSTVVADGAYITEGGKVSITATPASAAYTFSSWSVSGTGSSVESATANPATFTMGTENATVTANFVSAGPTVTIDPTSYNFGEVTVGTTPSPTHTFSVTPANLTEDLTITVPSGYSVSPSSISQSTTTATNVTVTFTPTSVTTYNGNLSISGGGLGSAVTASLAGTGGCITAPTLTYTSPVNITLEDGEVEYLLAPTGGGNGGSISYAVTTNPGNNGEITNGNKFYAIETGQYVVTATQAANGNYCECVATITVNVTSTDPTCEISPEIWDFGKVLTETYVEKTFTVNTANLEGNLTVEIDHIGDGFSVTPATINQTATSTDVTVRFAPTAATEDLTATLTISGGGLEDDVVALISGQGDAGYTVTFNPYSGSCTPTSIRVATGGSIATLPTATADGATFYGWATSKVASTPTAPTSNIVSAPYTPTGNVTLHAVYKIAKEFDNSAACAGSYKIYATVSSTDYYATGSISSGKYGSTTTAANGKSFTFVKETGYGNDEWAIKDGNNYVYYNSGANLGTTNSIADNCKWIITQGVKGTWRATSATTTSRAILFSNYNSTNKFGAYATSNIVNPNQGDYYDIEFASSSFTYGSETPVAKPTYNIDGGSYAGTQNITISCTTPGATIYYTTDGSDPTNSSSVYSTPVSISSTQTLKAIAMKDEMANSQMAYANYSIVPLLTTMDQIFAAASEIGGTAEDVAVSFNNWLVSGKSGDYVAYVTDNNGKGFKIYKYGHGFQVNDKLSGTVTGTPLKLDNGASQFTNLATSAEGLTVTEYGGTITPVAMTISELSGVNTGAVVTISNLTYNGTNLVDGSSNTITPNTSLYEYSSVLILGHDYSSVTGVFVMNNTTKQIHPRNADDIVEVEYDITLNDVPSGCTIGTDGDIATAKYGQTVTLTQSAAPGYRFISWSVNSGAVTVTNNQFTMPKGNVTVTATFAPTYAITVNVTPENTGTVTADPNPAIEGETVTLTIAPETGYALKSITANKTGASSTPVTITDNTITMPAYGVTVAAEFATEYSVTYNVNGGTGDAVVVKYGEGATVNAAAVPGAWTAPTGKLFKNWKTVASGEGTEYEVGDQITDNIADNYVLYAQWRDIVYTVKFSVNGTIVSSREVAYNTAIGALPADPELAPLTFLGWSSESATGATNVTASWIPTGENEDVTVYAVFGSMSDSNMFITTSSSGISNAYASNTAFTIGSIDFTCNDICKQGSTGSEYIQMRSSGFIYNDTDNSFGKITSIVVTYNTTPRSVIVKVGTSANPTSSSALTGVKDSEDDNIYTYTPSSGTDYGYVLIGASELIKVNSIVINYEAAAPLTVNIIDENTNMTTDIEATTCVVVKDGATLNFTGANNGNANNLIIEDGGQLILGNSNTGVQATVKKTISAVPSSKDPTNKGWYSISSPVDNASVVDNTNLVTASAYDLYMFDESEEDLQWINYNQANSTHGFTNMTNGRGYIYRNAVTVTLAFTGTVNTGDVEYTVTKTDGKPFSGFNLIGNPYTHTIYKGDGGAIDDSKLNEGFYIASTDGSWTTCVDNTTPIEKNQGILVEANAGGTITITNVITGGPGAKANHDNLMFRVENSEYSDVTYAMFDKGYGLSKINHRNSEIPMLYIPQNGEDYAIAMISDDTKAFNLNFKAMTTGKYTLSYKADGNFGYLHVIDRLTGEDVDMLLNNEYEFVASKNDNANRFIVRLAYSAISENSEDDIFVYQNGSDIVVTGEGELQIFDVMGRMIASQHVNGVQTVNVNAQGVYIMKLNEKTQKIVIR